MGDALQGDGGEQCVSKAVQTCSLREMRVMFSAWVAVQALSLKSSIVRICSVKPRIPLVRLMHKPYF